MNHEIGLCGLGSTGPTLTYDSEHFAVDFSSTNPRFFEDPREILPSGTVGEANRKYLHNKLDEILDKFLKEKAHG